MIEYKYKKRESKFTENGHTMFEEDVLQRLKRLAHLEEQIKLGQLLPIQRVVKEKRSETPVCPICKGTRLVYIDDVIKNTLCPDC